MLAAGEARDCLAPPRVGMTSVHQNIELIVLDKKLLLLLWGVCTHMLLCGCGGQRMLGVGFLLHRWLVPTKVLMLPQQAIHPWGHRHGLPGYFWFCFVFLCGCGDPAQGLSLGQ